MYRVGFGDFFLVIVPTRTGDRYIVIDCGVFKGTSGTGDIGSIVLPGRRVDADVSLNNWDAIVGFKGRTALGDERRWFIPYYADVGTGESKVTWQAMAGIGYAFRWGDVVAAWRYVDYEMKSGKKVENLTFNGPAVAAVFHW